MELSNYSLRRPAHEQCSRDHSRAEPFWINVGRLVDHRAQTAGSQTIRFAKTAEIYPAECDWGSANPRGALLSQGHVCPQPLNLRALTAGSTTSKQTRL